MKPFEPIGYFEFESETQLTFEPDCQRLGKYVFLKPTGFRKKPNAFTQNMSVAPLEIEFFGASGTSQEDTEMLSSLADQDTMSQEFSGYTSKYDLQLKVLNEDKVLKNL